MVPETVRICGLLLALIMLSACQESTPGDPAYLDCEQLTLGLLSLDDDLLSRELDALAQDLMPAATTNDQLGHDQNLETVVSRLNAQCSSLSATIICYACIKTLPLQSEIRIYLDSSGTQVSRVIDLVTPGDAPMTFRAVHL